MRLPLTPLLAPLLAGSLALLPLAACSVFQSPKQMRGMHVDTEELKQLVPGTTTRADVTSLLGSPTAHATFDDNTWIYIGQTTRPRIGRIEGVVSQDVVALTFDQNGVLRTVKHLNEDNSQNVAMVGRSTPSPGSSASFLQQLLGNIGRYSPGGIVGGAGPGDNTSPSGR